MERELEKKMNRPIEATPKFFWLTDGKGIGKNKFS
jgi:hypothetical protein